MDAPRGAIGAAAARPARARAWRRGRPEYQVEAVCSALRRARRDAGAGIRWPHVSGTVWALGFTSLFTDVSSEMVATVLPVYLVLYLGLTPFQFGIVDGLYHGVTALLRLASGVAVDRTGRSKEIALAGYGASAASRLGMLAAGASWPLIAGVVAFDRAAKGARAVPRDVLISLSSRPDGLATAFGVHRALDSAGAMLGPLVALAILGALPNAFDVVFVASFSVAVVGLGVLMLFVTNAEPSTASAPVAVAPPAAPARTAPTAVAPAAAPARTAPAAARSGAPGTADGGPAAGDAASRVWPAGAQPVPAAPFGRGATGALARASSWSPACCASPVRRRCSAPRR